MIPGKDYTDSFSPVVTYSSTRIAFGISLYIMHQKHREWSLRKKIGELAWKKKTEHAKLFFQIPECDDWIVEMYDVEAAFLNTEPGCKHYIKVPDGMIRTGMMTKEKAETIAFESKKSIYRNMDVALRLFIKYKGILKELGVIQCQIDSCVFYRLDKDEKLEIIITCHVDNSIICGRKRIIDQFMNEFEKTFKYRKIGKNEEEKHLGIWWLWKENEDDVFLEGSMDKMKQDIIIQYEEFIGSKAKEASTPAYPSSIEEK
jgi:hypothetical protein